MKSRLIYILILTLFLFQNAWAMEQTYLVFCDQQEINQEVEQHSHDDNTPAEHDHTLCNDCCHLSSPLVGITQITNLNTAHSNQQYDKLVLNNLHSIVNKPSTPPPII